jgi:hypothetical protein
MSSNRNTVKNEPSAAPCAVLLALSLLASACTLAEDLDDGDADEEVATHPQPGALARAIEATRAVDIARVMASGQGLRSRSGAAAPPAAAPGAIITVSGTVLPLEGTTVSFLPVAILGQGAALTDATGNFTIPNVTTPYDIVVGFDSGTKSTFIVYQGLLRPDPRLIGLIGDQYSTTISGTVSGGAGYPEPAAHRSAIHVAADSGLADTAVVHPVTGAYSLGASWDATPSTTVYLTAIQYQVDGSGMPTTFTGGRVAKLSVTDAAPLTAPVALGGIRTATVSGTYSHPPGYAFDGKEVDVESVGFFLVPLPTSIVDDGAFSLAAPVLSDRSLAVLTGATSPLGSRAVVMRRGVPPGTTGLDLVVPEAPAVIFPFDGAAGVDHSTQFLSEPFPEGIRIYQFVSAGTDPNFFVVSDQDTVEIPDLTALGAALPASASYSFGFTGLGPFADLEEFAGPAGPLPGPEVIIVTAPFIAFTTAP